MTDQWTIRKAVGDDLHFIYSTWGRSYRTSSVLGRSCRSSIFFPEQNLIMDWILAQESTVTLVAVLPDDPSIILGYLVYEPGILHYVFVKEAFTRIGIARSLYDRAGLPMTCTHKTVTVRPIMDKYPNIVYNPFLLFVSQRRKDGSTNKE